MRALVVHDDPEIQGGLLAALKGMGHRAAIAATGQAALIACGEEAFDVAMVGLHRDEGRSLGEIEEIQRALPQSRIVLLVPAPFVSTAFEAMRRGVFDYLAEPYAPKQIRWVLGRIEKALRLERGIAELQTRIAAADGGTLFLNRIAEMSPGSQRRLLRFLREGSYRRIGESRLHRSNVRIISSSDRSLVAAVAAGRFCADLFQRLNAISFTLPPLRERIRDLQPIAMEHLRLAARCASKRVKGFSPQALDALRSYSWPGNFRELGYVIQGAVMLASGPVLDVTNLPENIQCGEQVRIGGRVTLEHLENEHIRRIIASSSSLDEAATILGINPATLFRTEVP